MDKANDLIDYAKANPVVAGLVALGSAGAVAVVWLQSRGSNPPATSQSSGYVGDTTQPGRIVQIKNEVMTPAPTPLPAPQPSQNPPTGARLAFQPAAIPSGFECPNGTQPVYGLRAGTFQQTDGNVVCKYPDGRTRAVKKQGLSWSAWRRGQ